MMSEQKVPRSVEQRIVIKFLVGDTLPHTVVGVCGKFQRTGRFLQKEFDHSALFHAPRYLLFAHHSSNSQTGLHRF